MKLNVGRMDRGIRIVIGLVVLLAGYYYQQLWGFLGLFPFLSGAVGICPLYSMLGINRIKGKHGGGTCCATGEPEQKIY